jgi:hypothetical protein
VLVGEVWVSALADILCNVLTATKCFAVDGGRQGGEREKDGQKFE